MTNSSTVPRARAFLRRALPPKASNLLRRAVEQVTYPSDFTAEDIALCQSVQNYTMTSHERIIAMREAVNYVIDNKIEGDFVECGVWRGGSMMVAAQTLLARNERRQLYLFDTYEGMTAPSSFDVDHRGQNAASQLQGSKREAGRNIWCIADEADVGANMKSTGYPEDLFHLIAGDVAVTTPDKAPQKIALLRLDTDFYESTKHELQYLYPRLASGGVMIIDDYGYWLGAKKAVDEFLREAVPKPFMSRIDAEGRLIIKP